MMLGARAGKCCGCAALLVLTTVVSLGWLRQPVARKQLFAFSGSRDAVHLRKRTTRFASENFRVVNCTAVNDEAGAMHLL